MAECVLLETCCMAAGRCYTESGSCHLDVMQGSDGGACGIASREQKPLLIYELVKPPCVFSHASGFIYCSC